MYLQGIIYILAGLAFWGLGYSEEFRGIFNHFNIPTVDLGASKVMGYIFITFGILSIFVRVIKNKKPSD